MPKISLAICGAQRHTSLETIYYFCLVPSPLPFLDVPPFFFSTAHFHTGLGRKESEVSSDPPSSSPPHSSSRLSHWHGQINGVADDFFYRLGRRVALNPKKVVALALFGVLLCCSGFVNFRVESGGKS